jgi:hypothetical protein
VCVCLSVRPSVALVIQHARRMSCVILLSVACLAPPYFLYYLINGTNFREKEVMGFKMCVLIFFTTVVIKNGSPRYYHKCKNVFV